jgi:Putative zinc-finger
VTSSSRCTPGLREAVAAFALGALEPGEADQVSAHLAECADCRAQYGEFLELLPLLAEVSEQEAVEGPVRPIPEVLGRVLAAAEPPARYVSADRPVRRPAARRLRPRMALAAAAVVLLAGGVAVGFGLSAHTQNHQVVAASWTTSSTATLYPGVPASTVSATVEVSAVDSGSYIELTMDNIPKGYSCSLVVVDSDGNRQQGDNWTAPTSGKFTIPDMVSTPPGKVSSVQVMLPTGATLMTLAH